jgi:hypothetical protein
LLSIGDRSLSLIVIAYSVLICEFAAIKFRLSQRQSALD